MTQHTPEPWSYGEDNDGWYVSVGDTQIAYGLSEENACRIVACVNALHDMDNKEIDNIIAWAHGAGIGMALAMKDKAIGEYQLLVSDMKKQRDVFLDALHKIGTDGCDNKYTRIASKAIAKAGA